MAMVAAAFTQDQAMSRTQTTSCAIRGNRLFQYKIGAECKRLFHTGHAVGNGKDNGFCVGLAAPHFSDDFAPALYIVTIDEHSVEFAPPDGLASCVGGGNRLQFDGDRFQRPANDAQNFLVAREEESFQHHAQMYLSCHLQTTNGRNGTTE